MNRIYSKLKSSGIFFALLFITITQSELNAQDRAIYMLHGFPGDTRSVGVASNYIKSLSGTNRRWSRVKAAFPIRFNSKDGVDVNARSLTGTMRGYNSVGTGSGPRNIIFGSSYGGLVARRIMEVQGTLPAASGIITHGTPNAGAPVAANINRTVNWGANAISTIGLAFALEAIERNRIFGTFFGKKNLEGATDLLISIGIAKMGETINAQARLDMVPGSPRLNSLNTAPEGENRILTWAEETEDDLVFRVLGGAAETALSEPFTANRDEGVRIANNLSTTSRDREAVWRTRAENAGAFGDFYSGRYYTRKEILDLRQAYNDASRVLLFMDREYKNLAGFTVFENTGPGTPASCRCIEEGFEDGSEFYREYVTRCTVDPHMDM